MKRIMISLGVAALVSLSACGAEEEAEVVGEGETVEIGEVEGEEGAVLGEGEISEGGLIAEGEAAIGEGEAAIEGVVEEE